MLLIEYIKGSLNLDLRAKVSFQRVILICNIEVEEC